MKIRYTKEENNNVMSRYDHKMIHKVREKTMVRDRKTSHKEDMAMVRIWKGRIRRLVWPWA